MRTLTVVTCLTGGFLPFVAVLAGSINPTPDNVFAALGCAVFGLAAALVSSHVA